MIVHHDTLIWLSDSEKPLIFSATLLPSSPNSPVFPKEPSEAWCQLTLSERLVFVGTYYQQVIWGISEWVRNLLQSVISTQLASYVQLTVSPVWSATQFPSCVSPHPMVSCPSLIKSVTVWRDSSLGQALCWRRKSARACKTWSWSSRSAPCELANKTETTARSVMSGYEATHKSIPLFYSHTSYRVVFNQGPDE